MTASPTPVQRATWNPGDKPWVRRHSATAKLFCPFCGALSVVLSTGDLPDPGRVELYCDNSSCDVRRMVVLVTQDGTRATMDRADVRTLAAIDTDPNHVPGLRTPEIDLSGRSAAEVIARRQAPPAAPVDNHDDQ